MAVSSNTMAVSSNTMVVSSNTHAKALAHSMLQELLRASDLTSDELDRLETRADVGYSIHKMGVAMELAFSWRLRPQLWLEPEFGADPGAADPGAAVIVKSVEPSPWRWRRVQCFIDDARGEESALKSEIERVVKNTDLRAELHHLKLARHFPTTLEKVAIERRVGTTNIVTVTFKNGYHCSCPEDEVDSRDFLAKCQMIYDL